jgi:site-specific DNA-methyltransferase (adenine-specific)
MGVELLNIDCMEYMSGLPDKAFQLAIVDPPYGISQPAFRKESKNKATKTGNYHNAVFNQSSPNKEYFEELNRVSEHQIIWGGNYYNEFLPSGKKWIFWDKKTEDTQWGDGELAYTSFPGSITKFTFAWNGMIQGNMKNKESRIHPTQKPVALYKWLLKTYAMTKDGLFLRRRILDTHLGSGSSAIAAHHMGFDFVGCELDKAYYETACKRFTAQTSQQFLFK